MLRLGSFDLRTPAVSSCSNIDACLYVNFMEILTVILKRKGEFMVAQAVSKSGP